MLSRAVEHAEMKDAAAQLTQLSDERLIAVLETSRQERAPSTGLRASQRNSHGSGPLIRSIRPFLAQLQ